MLLALETAQRLHSPGVQGKGLDKRALGTTYQSLRQTPQERILEFQTPRPHHIASEAPVIRPLLLFIGFLLFPAALQAAPGRDWSRTVTTTPQGAFVVGNPGAKTRLVEYVSYTCSHCAQFMAEATQPLKSGWVTRGVIAIEVRNLVRDPYDLTAALLARCGGATRFTGDHEAIFAAFPRWIREVQTYDRATQQPPEGQNETETLIDIADKTGLIALMVERGIPAMKSKTCLSNTKALETVMAMTKRAVEQDKVTGTPSFLLNGMLTAAHDWASLRPLLPAPRN